MAARLRTSLAVVAVFAVIAAACGSATEPTAINLGGTDVETTVAVAPAETTSPAEAGTAETTPPATEAPRQRPEGPDAPDFTLALSGPGGTFSLSEEARPVFMVFWAEW